MPICKNCDSKFKNRVEINGKIKNLSHRKYCLSCSPFGKHNTKQIHVEAVTVNCKRCDRKYTYDSQNRQGHNKTYCNSCVINTRRFKFKEKCVQHLGGKCKECGYNKCNRALTFHHTNPNEKDFSISGMHCRKWAIVKAELDKCIILCANCHHEAHDEIEKNRG